MRNLDAVQEAFDLRNSTPGCHRLHKPTFNYVLLYIRSLNRILALLEMIKCNGKMVLTAD